MFTIYNSIIQRKKYKINITKFSLISNILRQWTVTYNSIGTFLLITTN